MKRAAPALRQFLISLGAGLTALGIVNLVKWLREPALRPRG